MCLVLFAFQQHPDYPLIVIANRDEYYDRPTRSAHWWDDEPDILAGRDLSAGGTWMGVNRRGRMAAVTNVREPGGMSPGELSRGELTRSFLSGNQCAEDFLENLQPRSASYSGYNLLLGDDSGLWFQSNRSDGIHKIKAGFYGISNGRFDEAWPKLTSGKRLLSETLHRSTDSDALLKILTDNNQASDDQLPDTGIGLEFERLLSSRFIHSPGYGTRASTLIRYSSNDQIQFIEKNFDVNGDLGEPIIEQFSILPNSE